MSQESKRDNISHELNVQIINDTRKFEIDLFWKRSNFFWLFSSATFTGFCLLRQDLFLSTLIANVGFFCTFCWSLVNRGSKFWQNSYQKYLAELNGYFDGPHKDLQTDWWTYRFSPSKLTIISSDILTCMWFALLAYAYFNISATALQVLLPFNLGIAAIIVVVSKGKD